MVNYLKEDTANPVDDAPVHLWYGTVADDVADYYDQAYVVLPDLSTDHQFGPCFWPRRDETLLPTRGDRCAVVFDNRGQAWMMAWWPDDPSPFTIPSSGVIQTTNNLKVLGWVSANPSGNGTMAFAASRQSDTVANRWYVTNDGVINWGSGIAATDTNLYRSTTGILKTDGQIYAVGNLCAKQGLAAQVYLGDRGPSSEAGITFGSAGDTTLYRYAAGVVRTDGEFSGGSGLRMPYGLDIAISGGTLTTTTGFHRITGYDSPSFTTIYPAGPTVNGKLLILYNVSGGTLTFNTGSNISKTFSVASGITIMLYYNAITNLWTPLYY